MTTGWDIHYYLLENSPWVDPGATVDGPKAGDLARAVTRVAVCWYPCITTLREAHAAGCSLLITHEPLFWEHARDEQRWRHIGPGAARQAFLDETGLAVLRAHDSWDQWPEIGIRDSWARFLGFEQRVYASENDSGHAMHAVYAIPPQRLDALARHIADKARLLGEDRVQVMGDPERTISRVALGVGCIGPDETTVARGAEACIMCYDGATYWDLRERLYEMGAAVITLEHGTTEMPGLESMCNHLRTVFPGVEFIWLAVHPRPWSVPGVNTGAARARE
jgi:putative NIF3 family GTP cyclohydrolase 1 type 2